MLVCVLSKCTQTWTKKVRRHEPQCLSADFLKVHRHEPSKYIGTKSLFVDMKQMFVYGLFKSTQTWT